MVSTACVLLQSLLDECRAAVLAAHQAMEAIDNADHDEIMRAWLWPVAALLQLELNNPTSSRQVSQTVLYDQR